MAIPVIMPKQGQSVETCIITKWFIKKGEPVRTGDILFSYETDKAAFDLESPADGILLDQFFSDGDEVPVLVNVAVIGNPGEPVSSFIPGIPGKPEMPEPKAEAPEKPKSVITAEPVSGPTNLQGIRISPRARRLAKEKGISFNEFHGSGPNGRIVFNDILNAGPAGGNEFTEQPLSNIRRITARAMHDSLQNSAQLTHHMSADVHRLLEARKKIKEEIAKGTGKDDITLNDMICWCVIRALLKFPEANSHFLDDRIKTFRRVHLGVAVDAPRGLMVPSVQNADSMDLTALSKELKSVAASCRKGNVNPELLKSTAASFTVSNLGNYGVEMFTPVINLPQVAILGVCTIIYRPADLGNGIFGFVPFIGLSLTYDHRAIDGGPATLFLKEIKEQIEKFHTDKS
jgi:pyruvate dehydrogenase E2 component (dihydrolipoamide acetyltransferase)